MKSSPKARVTAGISTVPVVLTASLLITTLLLASTQLVLSTHTGNASQGRLLNAQYAAESGIAHGLYRLSVLQTAISPNNFDFMPGGVPITATDLTASVTDFCDGGANTSASVSPARSNNWAITKTVCTPATTSAGTNRFSLLGKLAKVGSYASVLQATGLDATTAQAQAQALMASSVAQRTAWWTTFLSPATTDTQSGNVNYTSKPQVLNYKVESYNTATSTVPVMYRFYFKGNLTAQGTQTGATSTRVVAPSTSADNNGIYWFDIQPTSSGSYSFDAACTNIGFAYTGNGPLISDVPGAENQNALCHTFGGTPPSTATTMPADERANPASSSTAAINYNSFATQFRGGFYPGEVFNGDVFTNEFISFARNSAVTFNGLVGSAGCVRNPLVGATPANTPDFSNCPTQVADTYLRNTGTAAGTLEEVYVKSASSKLPANATINNAALQNVVQSWGGTGLKFNASNPVFNAPYRKLFNTPTAPSKTTLTTPGATATAPATTTTIAGTNMPSGILLDPQLNALRNQSLGLTKDGGTIMEDAVLRPMKGINIEELFNTVFHSTVTNSSIADKKGGPLPTDTKLDDGYGYNTLIDIQASDGWNTSSFGEPTTANSYNTSTDKYNINGNYQFVEFEFTPLVVPQNTAYFLSGTIYRIVLRINRTDCQNSSISPKDKLCGKMEYASYTGSSLFDQFSSVANVSSYPTSFNWKSIPWKNDQTRDDFNPTTGNYNDDVRFNGVIYGDGNLMLRNGNPRQGSAGGLAETSGALNTYSPAVASNLNLTVAAGKNMYILSDLTLQNRPVNGHNGTDTNYLNLYAGRDVKISAYSLPYLSGSALISPNQANQSNLSLDANIVTPNGRLTLQTSLTENNTNGEGTGFIPDMSNLNILGSVIGKYSMDVGRFMESVNGWRGYHRTMTADPRGSGLNDMPQNFTVSNQSSSILTSMSVRQDKAQ